MCPPFENSVVMIQRSKGIFYFPESIHIAADAPNLRSLFWQQLLRGQVETALELTAGALELKSLPVQAVISHIKTV